MKKNIEYILLVLALFISVLASAQVLEYNTKIKDGSLSNSAATPSSNAILELESTAKGFLLPRMSNAQRDAIPVKDREEGNGLSIYNTDTNCLNYWSKKGAVWMSLCGTLPPAVVTIDPIMCNKITLRTTSNSNLKQGQYLIPEDILYIDVNVATSGTYDISAVTNNGYYFSASGTFMNSGTIRVALKGSGVPVNGYTGVDTGDVLSFIINGKNVGNVCPNFKIPVDKDGTQFTINCGSTYTALGNYFIGVPVDPTKNYIDIKVDVTAIGNYKITTASSNGISFSGSGSFNTIGNGQIVRLYAEGVPTTAGTFSVATNTNSNGSINTPCSVSFTIKGVDYKVDLTKSTHIGEYVKGRALNTSNKITIEVEVLAPGKASFELKSGAISFSATDVVLNYTAGATNKQLVTLTNNGGILSSTDPQLTFVGTGKYSGSYSIDLKTPLVDYVLNCSSIQVNPESTFVPNVAMGAEHYVTATVNVITPGNYNIKTSPINGVYFEAVGTFSQVENGKTIKLLAKGTPLKEQLNVQYVIKTNSLSDSKNNCTINIDFVYPTRSFNILVLGDEEFGPGYPNGDAYKLLMNPDFFGPKGKVRTKGIKVTNLSEKNITTSQTADVLKRALKNQDIDILLIVQGGTITDEGGAGIQDFANEGGVTIVSNQVNIYIAKLVNNAYEPSYTNFFAVYNDSGSIPINNEFLSTPSVFESMKGKRINNFKAKYSYWEGFDPKYYEPLIPAPTGRAGDYFAVKHRTKGYMYIGYGGWMASVSGRSVIGPVKATVDGRPQQTTFNGERVDNALFFIKVMEWAINTSFNNRKK